LRANALVVVNDKHAQGLKRLKSLSGIRLWFCPHLRLDKTITFCSSEQFGAPVLAMLCAGNQYRGIRPDLRGQYPDERPDFDMPTVGDHILLILGEAPEGLFGSDTAEL